MSSYANDMALVPTIYAGVHFLLANPIVSLAGSKLFSQQYYAGVHFLLANPIVSLDTTTTKAQLQQ